MQATAQSELDSVSGSILRVIARNEDSGWAAIEIDSNIGRISLVGGLHFVDEGLQIQAEGIWITHPSFGRQLKVTSARVFEPVGVAGIERFLKSGCVKGIGPVFAKKIVDRFGEQTLTVLQEQSWQLKYLKGVGPKRISAVAQGMREYKGRMEVMSFLHGKLGAIRAARVFDKYGLDARALIAENPYRLIDDFEGVGFLLADQVARDVGIGLEATERLTAAVTAVLREGAGQGHTCLPVEAVIDRLTRLLGARDLAERAAQLEVDRAGWHQVEHAGMHYLELDRHQRCDQRIAERIIELLAERPQLPDIDVSKAIPWVAATIGIEFEAGQVAAIEAALKNKVTIITGGPGVGKTTILDGLLRILEAKGVSVALAAPTGRAARRMQDATGREAQTVHRLLEYNPKAGGFLRRKTHPLDSPVVVIDEASMLDASLAASLLDACPAGGKVVIVGDADQLPSVGAGNVLSDLIESGLVRVARLTKPYRQAAHSPIISNAHLINNGVVPELDNAKKGFEFIDTVSKEATAQVVQDLLCEILPSEGLDPIQDVMCLLPMNKGVVGIETMNQALQERLNARPRAEVIRGGRRYRVGDRVIQLKNNREIEVFNGDVGVIESIDEAGKLMHIRFDSRTVAYPFGDLHSLSLGYCLTVHRAQGSEYPCVVAAVDMAHSIMLTRKLLYTAVTRARERVILVGQKRAVHIAVSAARAYHRHTLLTTRLKEALQTAKAA